MGNHCGGDLTYLPLFSIFSSDLGHFILKLLNIDIIFILCLFRRYIYPASRPMWDPDGSHVGSPCVTHMAFVAWPHLGPRWGSPGGTKMGPMWAPHGTNVGYLWAFVWGRCGTHLGRPRWRRCGLHSVSRNSERRPELGCLGRKGRVEIHGRQTVDGIP